MAFLLVAVAACSDGGDLIDPPTTCDANRLTYVYKLDDRNGAGDHGFTSFSFQNALDDTHPGMLQITGGAGSDMVRIDFADLVADGGDVAARGTVTISGPGIIIGNCESASLSGRLYVDGNSRFRFSLTDLHEQPACTGDAVAGSFAGCYQGM